MSHVFISYSRKDADYAQKLAAKLRQELFDVWIDQSKIRNGDEWWEEIEKAITDCVIFLIIMSPDSKASKWVKREMHLAEKLDKPTFPLLLSGESWSIYLDRQYSDVSDRSLPDDSFYTDLRKTYHAKANYSKLRYDGIYKCVNPDYPEHHLKFRPDSWVEIYNEPQLMSRVPTDRDIASVVSEENYLVFKVVNRISSYMHSHEYNVYIEDAKLRVRFQRVSHSIVGEITGERPEIREYVFLPEPTE